jgi:hypothetical protein
MRWTTRLAPVLILASVVVPARAASRPIICEGAGTFAFTRTADAWWPAQLQATATCSGDMAGPYQTAIDGVGLVDDTAPCGGQGPSNALLNVRVTSTSLSSGKTTVRMQKWVIYFSNFSPVASILIRAPHLGAGTMISGLFSARRCVEGAPVSSYRNTATLRWVSELKPGSVA